jgi:hypothetical protein
VKQVLELCILPNPPQGNCKVSAYKYGPGLFVVNEQPASRCA